MGTGINVYGLDVVWYVFMYEVGYCIGFWYFDFFNCFFSCGLGGNEGLVGIGVYYIFGIHSGFDFVLVMNLCYLFNFLGVFLIFDKIVFDMVY